MQVLFITSSRLGDAVLSTGLLAHISRHYPQARFTIACGPLPASLFEGLPGLSRVVALEKQKYNRHWLKLWREVVATRWDMVVDLRNSAVSRLVLARSRYIYGRHIDSSRHKVEQNAAVMRLDDVPAPRIWISGDQRARAESLLPHGALPILAIGPTANWIGKTWPAERFVAVIERITAPGGILPGARVAVFAAPGEEEEARKVLNAVPMARRHDLIARADPGTVAAALSRCALYIGNDSGLMHCAAAAGVPTIGLFGPSYPHLYRPWGAHATYARTPEGYDELTGFEGYDPKTLGHTLMTSLSTENVVSVIEDFWKAREQAA